MLKKQYLKNKPTVLQSMIVVMYSK